VNVRDAITKGMRATSELGLQAIAVDRRPGVEHLLVVTCHCREHLIARAFHVLRPVIGLCASTNVIYVLLSIKLER